MSKQIHTVTIGSRHWDKSKVIHVRVERVMDIHLAQLVYDYAKEISIGSKMACRRSNVLLDEIEWCDIQPYYHTVPAGIAIFEM